MNSKFKITMISAGLIGMLLSVSPAYAGALRRQEKNSEARQHQREEHHENFMRELGLTEEQAEQLRTQKEQRREAGQQLRESLKSTRQALGDELAKENLDQNKINAIRQEMKALNNQMIDSRIDGILDMRNTLTPDQYRQFHQKAGKMRKHREHKEKHFKDGGKMRGGW